MTCGRTRHRYRILTPYFLVKMAFPYRKDPIVGTKGSEYSQRINHHLRYTHREQAPGRTQVPVLFLSQVRNRGQNQDSHLRASGTTSTKIRRQVKRIVHGRVSCCSTSALRRNESCPGTNEDSPQVRELQCGSLANTKY